MSTARSAATAEQQQVGGQAPGDIATRSDVHDLVVHFYREIVFDDLMNPLFDEVAQTDWATHIPKLIDYWCRVLLSEPGYDGVIVAAHREVHGMEPAGAFRIEHFEQWFALWRASVDARWAGPVAEQAKSHAARIGSTLARRLLQEDWAPPGY